MKKFVKILSILCLPLLLVACFVGAKNIDVVNAESNFNTINATGFSKPSDDPSNKGKDYVIDSYNVDIVVGENNVYHIVENITAYFNAKKHGIKRYIPISNKIKRVDGSEGFYLAKIKNIKVNNTVEVGYNQDYVTLKIGNEKKLVSGSVDYKISYTFDAGKDLLKDKDEFYFNIIGTKWDTIIGNVSFSISMPKEFDASKLGFSSGDYGSTDSTNINYTVDGNRINGSYNGVLNKYNGITVRLELPEGYFSYKMSKVKYVYFILPIVLSVIALVLWFIFGRDNGVVKTVEFYPPYKFNSLEMAFYYKGKVDNRDVVSLLVYLASKGYIKIVDNSSNTGKRRFNKELDITLEKLREYTGNNQCEKDFMEGLFKSQAKRTLKDVPKDFYQVINSIKTTVSSKEKKKEIFNNTTAPFVISIIALCVTSCFIIFTPLVDYYDFAMAIGVFVVFAMTIGFLVILPWVLLKYNPNLKIGLIVWSIVMLGVATLIMMNMPISLIFKVNKEYLLGFICGLGCIIVESLCVIFMGKRNAKGNEILGKILGFKQFLNTAEKSRLEALVNENSSYFYDILPYAYVLGISKKWINKFEGIALAEPDWYSGVLERGVISFMELEHLERCINKTVNSISSTTTSQQISANTGSSSGGFSGGGFSGGGGGGGGGSSW